MLDIKLNNDPSVFWELADEWIGLLSKQPDPSPFVTPHWLGIAYDFFVSDEELSLITVRDNFHKLNGILPLVRRGSSDVSIISFPPSAGYGYYDFIIEQKYRNEAVEEALRLMRGAGIFRAELGPFSSNSPTIWALEKVSPKLGMDFEKIEVGSFMFLELPDTMDELIFSMKPSERKKFTKLVKRAHRLAEMTVKVVDRTEQIDEGIDSLLRIMGLLGKDPDPGHEAFLREISRTMARHGWLSIRCLDADGWRVAVALVLKYGQTMQILIEDVDPEAIGVQAGAVLLVNIIKDAIAQGIKKLEILDEIEGLKVGFPQQKLVRIEISTKNE